jgi:diguanylate cyclase (GGDEF)-like protein
MLGRAAQTSTDALDAACRPQSPESAPAVMLVSLEASDEAHLHLVRSVAGLGPRRPAIVVMGRSGQDLVGPALDAGADDYLTVPTGAADLIARLRIVSERRRIEGEQMMLRRIAVDVAAGRDPSLLYGLVASELASLLSADGGRVIRYLGPRRAELLGVWRRSGFEQIPSGTTLELAPSWALTKVQASGRGARSELTKADAEKLRAPFRASLAAPVQVDGSLWGAVAVTYVDASDAHEEALPQLERVAELISLAVSNSEARERLTHMATTDALTGLLNHGAFHQRIEEEVARSARHGGALSLALLDLDHFKQVNDHYGHRIGDAVLQGVAGLMRSEARASDVVGRVGGEELAWLMPESDLLGAAEAAERLRRVLADTTLGGAVRVTASIGIADLAKEEPSVALFSRADTALYRAKASGRDCVRVAEAPSRT